MHLSHQQGRTQRRVALLFAGALLLGAGVFLRGATAHADAPPGLTEVSRSAPLTDGLEVQLTVLIDPKLTDGAAALNALLPAGTEADAGRATAAYVVNQPWDAEDIPVPVQYDDEFDPYGVSGRPVMQWAMATWNAVPGQSFRYVDAGTTTAFASAECLSTEPDGVNSVRFSYLLPYGVLGSTCTITARDAGGARHIVEFDMQFDGTTDWSVADSTPHGEYDLKSTVLHEFGHALGLGHSGVPGAVMQPEIGSGEQVRTPTSDDIAAVRALYGVADTPTPAPPTATPTIATPVATAPPTAVPTVAPPTTPAASLPFHLRMPGVAGDSAFGSTSLPPSPPVVPRSTPTPPPATATPVRTATALPTTTPTRTPSATATPTRPALADSVSEVSDADEFVMLWNDIRTARMTSSASGVTVYLQSWSADGFAFYDNGLGDTSHLSVDFYFGSTNIGSEDLYVAIYGSRITVYHTTNGDFTAVYNTTWSGSGQVLTFTVPRGIFPTAGTVHWDATGAEARFSPDCSYSYCSWFDYDWVPEVLAPKPAFDLR